MNRSVETYLEQERQKKRAGSVDGKHYLQYVEQVKQLKREGCTQEVLDLLFKLADAAEREAALDKTYGGHGLVPPWYCENIAIIYRKEKRYADEVAILERLQRNLSNFTSYPELAARLNKARELLKKQQSGKE
jgi:hypothetical protein